jgi:rubrerythrin
MAETEFGPPIEASMWQADLFAHLTSHADAERDILDEYVTAAKQTKSKALSYLVDLLIEDEIRHHTLFEQLAKSLKTLAELSGAEPEVPYVDFQKVDRSAVLEVNQRLLTREREDRRELKRLQRELQGVKDSTLWSLLVDVMRRDTEKHIAILGFVDKHTR